MQHPPTPLPALTPALRTCLQHASNEVRDTARLALWHGASESEALAEARAHARRLEALPHLVPLSSPCWEAEATLAAMQAQAQAPGGLLGRDL